MTEMVLVLTTVAAAGDGESIARTLVEERLAACVNLHGPMTSAYRWRGAVEVEPERQLVIKTTRARMPALRARLAALHPYTLPELVVIPVIEGSQDYLDWVAAETAAEAG
jgi:periplasmic divalent cation tolerance protein